MTIIIYVLMNYVIQTGENTEDNINSGHWINGKQLIYYFKKWENYSWMKEIVLPQSYAPTESKWSSTHNNLLIPKRYLLGVWIVQELNQTYGSVQFLNLFHKNFFFFANSVQNWIRTSV